MPEKRVGVALLWKCLGEAGGRRFLSGKYLGDGAFVSVCDGGWKVCYIGEAPDVQGVPLHFWVCSPCVKDLLV